MHTRITTAAVTAVIVAAGASPAAAPAATPAPSSHPGYTARVTNPWFPLLRRMRWVYRGREGGANARDVVRVAARVATIDGARCAVVLDRLYRNGRLAERTTDWYSQDPRGRVHYFGERTAELDRHGHVTSREGSWRSGRRGARAGVFMPAHPRVGESFAQEHDPGTAEDHFTILSRRATISVPYGTFRRRALMTKETTPLEPGVEDRKWYARGIGQLEEATVKGGDDRLRLVDFRRR
jgi:hypothetical protein